MSVEIELLKVYAALKQKATLFTNEQAYQQQNLSLELFMSYLIGLFGIFALFVGIILLARPAFGKRFFGDWAEPKTEVARLVVITITIASSWPTRPNLVFLAGCIVAVATIFFAIMRRWERGHDFVQSHLVESELGTRVYTICAIIPMGALLVAGTVFALGG